MCVSICSCKDPYLPPVDSSGMGCAQWGGQTAVFTPQRSVETQSGRVRFGCNANLMNKIVF